jgi:hypothetical protein
VNTLKAPWYIQHPAGEHHGRVEQGGAAHPASDDRGVERERGGGHGVERDERHMEARIRKLLLRFGWDGGVLGCGVEREVGVSDGGRRPGQPPGFHGRGSPEERAEQGFKSLAIASVISGYSFRYLRL